MANTHDRCFLYESSGQLLASGYCEGTAEASGEGTVLMVVLDQPGRLVARSLMGPVRDIHLHRSDGTLVAAQIARVYFDSRRGRMCEVQVNNAPHGQTPAAMREPAVTR